MNGLAKRTLAILAVLAMILPMAVCVCTDSEDTAATDPGDCTKYYYNQLNPLAKKVYDGMVNLSDGNMTSVITVTKTELDSWIGAERSPTIVENYIHDSRQMAIDAITKESPMAIYYHNLGCGDGDASYTYNEADVEHVIVLTINYQKYPYYTSKSSCDAEINAKIAEINGTLDKSTTLTTLQSIHAKVAETLTYSLEGDSNKIRSVYSALVGWEGQHNVVCEGYAKMFKVLCDSNDIPCLIVTGDVADSDDPAAPREGHMWNYVYMSDKDKWYVVDCTWDDQSSLVTTYFLAGTNCDGFHSKVGNSHTPNTTISAGFNLPTLSSLSYQDSSLEYLVTFMSNSVKWSDEYVVENDYAAAPANPSIYGKNFLYWYETDENVAWDFAANKITHNTTLTAKFTDNPVWTITFDTNGGSAISSAICEKGDTIVLGNGTPVKSGATFKEWNTSKDGNGMSFKAGDSIKPTTDLTLYAVWDYGDTSPFKIDTIVANAGEWLNGETNGINNSYLLIGGITAVVALLAVLVISRK